MTDLALELIIKPRSPLLLGTDQDHELFIETRQYVPGATLRGALARAIQEAKADEDLQALFGPGVTTPIFENLHPSWSESYTYPLPLSARTCKRHGGFATRSKAHGVGDILIRQAVLEEALLKGVKLPLLYTPRCPSCGGEVTRSSIEFYESTAGDFYKANAQVRRFSRTAINRRRGTAADQLLYTLETIEPGRLGGDGAAPLFFRGAVRCQPAQEKILRRWLPRVQWIGRERSRGLGQVGLELVEDDEELAPLPERLEKFDQAVRQERRFYKRVAGMQPPGEDTRFFSLDLLAPTIFTRCGLPAVEPELADLGLANEAEIYRAFTDRDVIGGWHMGAGLPRRTALATLAGSVYMVQTTGLSLEQLAERLKDVETRGLGQERGRGFGRVLISSPFHYEPEVTL